ncbi:MAG: MFS transporter [Microlunatus sp.]|nr:MFS transporter [Microlunatus sp.]
MPARRTPAVAGYLAGATTARLGDEMTAPALLLLALAATGTTSAGPLLVALLSAAAALGGPLVGGLLDRSGSPGRLIGWSLLGCGAGIAVIAVFLGPAPLPVVLVTAVAVGLLRPVLSGGWSSQLRHVVDDHRLPRAVGLDAVTFDLAAFAGPGLAGLSALLMGARSAVLAASALLLIAVPLARAALPDRRPPDHRSGQLVPALAAILRLAALRRATLVSTLSYVGMGLLSTSLPLLSSRVLGDTDVAPLLVAVLAGSGLAANLLINLRRSVPDPDRLLLATVCVLVPGSALVVLPVIIDGGAPVAILLCVAAMIAVGMADGPQLAAVLRIRHREAPEQLRAGIFTTGASIKIFGYAIGAGLCGPLSGRSLTATLLAATGCQAAAVIGYAVSAGRARVGALPAA